MTLALVTAVLIPTPLIRSTHDHLRRMGAQGCEGWVLWSGTVKEETAEVTHAYVPEQRAFRTGDGVCVVVESKALHALNFWLYQNRLDLIAQVHSHPNAAYHSETDNTYPIATAVGSFSIVVPNFAAKPIEPSECAIFRLNSRGDWEEITKARIGDIFRVRDHDS